VPAPAGGRDVMRGAVQAGAVPAPAVGRDVMRGAVQAGAVPAGTRVAVLVNGATRSSAEILAGECVCDASLRRILTVYAVCILYTDGWRCWSTARRGRRRRYWQASACVMPACPVCWNEAYRHSLRCT
jgi:hypothetical protein